jgi:hypothetical protein
MKKIVFLFGLLFCSSVFAQSNWVYVTNSNIVGAIFVDVNSIQRSGDSVTFWEKTNLKIRENGVLSSKGQLTINCRTRERILRWLFTYDDRDNMGKLLLSGDPRDSWEPIPPDSVIDEIRLFVCKYK